MPAPARRHPHADADGEKTAEGATEQPGGPDETEAGNGLDADALEGKVRPDVEDVHGEKVKSAIRQHEDGDMTVTLAHGLPEGNEFIEGGAPGVPEKSYKMSAAHALTLIRAGYTTANLDDPATIRAQYRRP